MIFDNPLASFKIFYFILAYEFQNTTAGNPLAELFDAPAGTKIGRVSVVDESKHSSLFLTGKTTQVSIDLGNDSTFRLVLEEPSSEDELYGDIRKKIRETPAQMASAMKELTDKLEADTNLNAPKDNAAWLVRFLRARDYNVPKTVELIYEYYRFKGEHKLVYDGLIPSHQKDIFEDDIFTILPRRDQSGALVLLAKAGKWNGKYSTTLMLCRVTVALTEMATYEPISQLGGFKIIVDMADMNFTQYKRINFGNIQTMIHWIKNCMPFKLRGVNIINKPSWFFMVENTLVRYFVKDIRDVFFVHKNFSSLHKQVSPAVLPATYGGHFELFEVTPDEWEVFLKDQDKEYEKLNSYGFKSLKNVQSGASSSKG